MFQRVFRESIFKWEQPIQRSHHEQKEKKPTRESWKQIHDAIKIILFVKNRFFKKNSREREIEKESGKEHKLRQKASTSVLFTFSV